ncbi:hypothetical protein ACFL6I_10090 [candidate division KSB1 bacterium]
MKIYIRIFAVLVAAIFLCGLTSSAEASETRKISFSLNGKGYERTLPNKASGEVVISFIGISKSSGKEYKFKLKLTNINEGGSKAEFLNTLNEPPVTLYEGRTLTCENKSGSNLYIKWDWGPQHVKKIKLNSGSYTACKK